MNALTTDASTTGSLSVADVRAHAAGDGVRVGLGVRIVAILATAVGGAIHLWVWPQGYANLPVVGPMILLNAIASAAVVVGLLARPSRLVFLGGLLLALGTLGSLVAAHTVGIAGFTESVWTTEQIAAAAAAVLAAIAAGWGLRRR